MEAREDSAIEEDRNRIHSLLPCMGACPRKIPGHIAVIQEPGQNLVLEDARR
jgi:hypothetical protein